MDKFKLGFLKTLVIIREYLPQIVIGGGVKAAGRVETVKACILPEWVGVVMFPWHLRSARWRKSRLWIKEGTEWREEMKLGVFK